MNTDRSFEGNALRRELDQAVALQPEPDFPRVYRLADRKRRARHIRVAALGASLLVALGVGFAWGFAVRQHRETRQMVQEAVQTRLSAVMEARSFTNVAPLVASFIEDGGTQTTASDRNRLFRISTEGRWWRDSTKELETRYPQARR